MSVESPSPFAWSDILSRARIGSSGAYITTQRKFYNLLNRFFF